MTNSFRLVTAIAGVPMLAMGFHAVGLAPALQRPPLSARIFEIQGRTHYSGLAGRLVRSTGIVTSIARGVATLQDPEGDGDPTTSDALMVELPGGSHPRIGDRVTITGHVAERVPGGTGTANLTVTTIIAVEMQRAGRGRLPAPVRLGPRAPAEIISADELPIDLRDSSQVRRNRYDPGADKIDYLEALEAMRVTVPAPVAVSSIQVYGPKAAEIVVLPDGGARVAGGRRTAAGGILLQSGPRNLGSQNPERIQLQLDGDLVPGWQPAVAVGDRLEDATGVLRYDFGNYEVALTGRVQVRSTGQTPPVTPPPAGHERLTLATYNVLNLSAQPEDSVQRLLLGRQLADPLGAPPIVALQEIQDNSGERDDGTTDAGGTLSALARAVRLAGGPAYRWFDVPPADGRQGGAPGGNIRNAFMYDPRRVRLLRDEALTPALLAAAGAPKPGAFRNARDPLLGVFEVEGRRLTVINNHLSSRYGSTPTYGAVQPFVQAGESERAEQAAALHAYARWLLAREPDARLVILGDMNTFEFTEHLTSVLPGTPPLLHALTGLAPAAERYSYNFEGNSQVLDHVFVSRALLDGAEIEYVHLNVDYPAVPETTASDHDPVLARFRW